MEYNRFRVVFITFPTLDSAKSIARFLVENRLIACANLIPGILSIYRWEGRIHEDGEVFLVGKTHIEKIQAVITAVQKLHPYENPEVIFLPVDDGSPNYLAWIVQETS